MCCALVGSGNGRASADWFWSSSKCCEEEGWYQLDGGPLSWACPISAATIASAYYELVKDEDYEAAKLAAESLFADGRCAFVSHSKEFRAGGRKTSHRLHDMRPVRVRGTKNTYLMVFHEAITRIGVRPNLDSGESHFVAWLAERQAAQRATRMPTDRKDTESNGTPTTAPH